MHKIISMSLALISILIMISVIASYLLYPSDFILTLLMLIHISVLLLSCYILYDVLRIKWK